MCTISTVFMYFLRKTAILCVLLALAAAACGTPSKPASSSVTLHLGHFPNLTHAPAIYGLAKGIFAKDLGSNVMLDVKTFNAGPEAVTALFSGSLDIAYVGPNPSINAFQKSNGEAVRIIAGATSGGAALVTKPSITSPDQLRGKTIATPQLGNTQDVALRSYLHERGLNTTTTGGGDVKI